MIVINNGNLSFKCMFCMINNYKYWLCFIYRIITHMVQKKFVLLYPLLEGFFERALIMKLF